MKTIFKRSGFVWALLFCLILVNGAMAAPSVAHAEHHGAHQTGTHATGICAWFCASGQNVESSSVNFESVLQVIGWASSVHADPVSFPFSSVLFLRGPPARPL